MKKRHLLLEFGIVSFALLMLVWIFIPKFLASQRIVLENAFPDTAVRQAVINAFRIHGESSLTVDQVRTYKGDLRINNAGDLSGLKHFKHLQSLSISSETLTEIDLSILPQLEHLSYSGKSLKQLNSSKNFNLKTVSLISTTAETPNEIPVLDFSQNQKITKLTIRNFCLETLDVSNLSSLYDLRCYNNFYQTNHQWQSVDRGLTSLDLSHNLKLKTLRLSFNKLKELDLSNNPQLWDLDCSYNELTSLNLSKNAHLRMLDCGANQLKTLDISACTGLDRFSCYRNQLTELNVFNNQYIRFLRCSDNQIEKLDIRELQKLRLLDAHTNPIEQLQLPDSDTLESINIGQEILDEKAANKIMEIQSQIQQKRPKLD